MNIKRGNHLLTSTPCPPSGRILRKKKAKPGQAASAEEYDAFFYTLVTLDTQVGPLLGVYAVVSCCGFALYPGHPGGFAAGGTYCAPGLWVYPPVSLGAQAAAG